MSEVLDAVTIPKWGIEMTHGTIVAWHKAVGDTVSAGEEIVDIETDKIVNSFEARTSGTLVRVLASEGEELAVGHLIGVIAKAPVDDEQVDAFVASHSRANEAGPATKTHAERASMPADAQDQIRIAPALRRKLEKAGLDLSQVTATGPHGRVTKEDVDRALAGGPNSAPAGQSLGAQQAAVARKLSQAQATLPLYHVTMEADVGASLAWLKSQPADAAPTINDLIIVAVQHALSLQPALNKTFDGDRVVDIEGHPVGLAVAADSDVVMAPVVKTAHGADLAILSAETRDLIGRARAGQLKATDQAPAAITISNLGMYGVTAFTAMVTPPQVMVLSVGAVRRIPAFNDAGDVVSRDVISLTLGSDHRVINGAQAATFLRAVVAKLESADA